MTEINWGYNCLTTGVHHGRPETLWNLPLLHALTMFDTPGLKELVVARIYNDAMQFVKRNDADHHITTQAWANRVAALAEEKFILALATKMSEIQKYYSSPEWERDVEGMIQRVKENKLSPHYQPLHSHDSINMLCRILGVGCSITASKEIDGSE